jgi:quercetin dioxygenase-like cupin family protein
LAHHRKFQAAEVLPREYGRIDLLATWRDGLRNISVIHLVLEPQSQTKLHEHPNEEIVFVLSGTMNAIAGDKQYELEPLDTLAIFAGEPHKFINYTHIPCKLIVVVSPHRDPNQVTYLEK